MNLKSRLFKKPWQHKDPATRARAVQESDDAELKAELAQLAQSDEDASVRLAALKRINTEPFWLDARLRESDAAIRAAADDYLARSVPRSDQPDLRKERLEWFGQIEDADLIRQMAVKASDPALRRAALSRIKAQGFLGDCYISERDDDIAAELLERIDQTSTLERMGQRLRKTSKKRAQAVVGRLANLRAASGAADPDHQAAETLVHRIEVLARGSNDGDQAGELEQLIRAWAAVRQPDETLKRRFEGAEKIVRAALDRPARPVAEPSSEPEAEQAQEATPSLAEAADHIRTTIRQARKSLKPAELLGNWDRAWNQIGQASAADLALKEEMLPLLRELQAQTEQKAETSKAAEVKEVQPDPAIDLDARLDKIGEFIEQGDIAGAHELIRTTRSDYDRIPGRSRPRAIGGRLQRMEGRLKEMRNWQHWSNNKHRDELIERLEKLPESGQHPDAITASLKEAREEWQRLEKLEVLPGDRKRFAAPPGQWRRFQAACKNAFETAKPFFEKRSEVQQDNLEQLEKFIELGMGLAQAEQPDAKKLQQTMRSARQAIRRMDDLPPKTRGRSAARLRELMDAISGRLDQVFEQVELTKRRLITEARALAHEKDIKTAIDKAKALQAEWQKAGSGRRKIEQKLWEEFREPIDPLFDQLKGERDEQKQADQEALAELKSLCEQAEALVKVADEELDSARGRMTGLVEDWFGRQGRPPKLNQRFEKAEAAFRQRIENLERKAEIEAQTRIETLAETVQKLWETRLDQGLEALEKLLPAATESDEALGRDMLERARSLATPETAQDQLEELVRGNAEAARQIVVEMEFLSGLDTPESDRKLRMDYQVRRLAQRMSERGQQPELEAELATLKTRWYQSLPQPPDVHKALARRFEKSRQVIESMIGL